MVTPTASIPKQYVVVGETGMGKSTFIEKTFRSSYPCKIGRGRCSETLLVDPFYPSNNTPIPFRNCVFLDSIGFLDTKIWKAAEVFEQITIGVLKAGTRSGKIDGFIIFESSISNRSRLQEFFAELQIGFSVEFIRSIVVAINRYEFHNQNEMQSILDETRKNVSEIISSSRVRNLNIPIVIINCDSPSSDEIANLSRALNTLPQYQLTNLAQKEQEIERIYQELIRNRANILRETRQKVVMISRTDTIRDPVVLYRKEIMGDKEPWFKIGGIGFGSKNTFKWVDVPYIDYKDRQVQVEVPTINQEEVERLINSEEYYKELALKTFVDLNMNMYLSRTRK